MAGGDRWRGLLEDGLSRSIACFERFRADGGVEALLRAAELLIEALERGGQVLIFGNGGSAAQAQHMAAELVNRFLSDTRPSLRAVALTTDTSILTSTANDRSSEAIFRIQLEALGSAGDVAFGISTSGNSENVNQALRAARERGMRTIGLSGRDGGRMAELVDVEIRVAERHVPQIQEVHLAAIHLLCHVLDEHFDRAG